MSESRGDERIVADQEDNQPTYSIAAQSTDRLAAFCFTLSVSTVVLPLITLASSLSLARWKIDQFVGQYDVSDHNNFFNLRINSTT